MNPRTLIALAASLTLVGATLAFEPQPDPVKPVKPVAPVVPLVKPKAAPTGLEVGNNAPDWEHKDRDGKTVKLSDLKGKVVLMDFWATWCGPCKKAMPNVQSLHEKYKDKGFLALGMNDEQNDKQAGPDGKKRTGAEKAADYMDAQHYTYGLIVHAKEAQAKYKVNGIPAFYLIGHDGKIAYKGVGYSPESEEQLNKAVEKAVAAAEAAKKQEEQPKKPTEAPKPDAPKPVG